MLLAQRTITQSNNAITSLVGEELHEGHYKWSGSLAAPNGFVYGIPYNARRVVKFNPVDKSITEIGPDFGNGACKWRRGGAITDSGIIYCPQYFDRGILKIDTNTDTVIVLDVNLLPERGHGLWAACALALDGCIYCMPNNAHRIMKLDPNDNDAMSSVGDDLGDGVYKCVGTVVGIDGSVYGIPHHSNRIIKYHPINDTTSIVGEEADEYFRCCSDAAIGRDGCIYALANKGRVLKIDTVNNSHCFVGDKLDINVHDGAGDAILGIDGCIYWPPRCTRFTVKYDTRSNHASLVGDDLGKTLSKWMNGALAADGVIYCIPFSANQVLSIDPLGEFLATTKAIMQEHPEEFGYLFQTIEADEDSSIPSLTTFDIVVLKFGHATVFEVLEKAMKPLNDYCKESNLFPFMIAASYKESDVGIINHLLRRDLSWVHSCIISLEGSAPKHKK